MATPLILTALNCWKRLSERGPVFFFSVAKVLKRHQLAVRPLDVGAFELVGVEALDALELRDHLVAAALEVEAVHEVAAHQRRQVRADGRHVQAQRGHLVAVHHQLDFGLVDLGVNDRREGEHAAGRRLLLQLLGELQDGLRLSGGADDELHRELAAARQRGRGDRKGADARDAADLALHLRHDLEHGALPFAPGLEHQAGRTRCPGR